MPIKQCKYCGKDFNALQKELNRGNGKFCSLSCSTRFYKNSTKPIPNTICNYCGTKFYRNRSKKSISKSGLQFCCRKCKDEAQKIGNGFDQIQPPHYGQRVRSDYRSIALENVDHIQCVRCGYDKISSNVVVHHKNRDKTNNDISNLELLCRNCHYEEHMNDGYSIP